MKKYIGTKQIKAKPMTRGKYNIFRGWTIPENENPDDKGYIIKYSDEHISWSPENHFEQIYRMSGQMNFGHALEIIKSGGRVARKGWNGKNQYIELASNVSYVSPKNKVVNVEHIDMGNKAIAFVGTSGVQLGWLASQSDMLSEDWCIVE